MDIMKKIAAELGVRANQVEAAWNEFDMVFDVDSVRDNCKFCSIIVNKISH